LRVCRDDTPKVNRFVRLTAPRLVERCRSRMGTTYQQPKPHRPHHCHRQRTRGRSRHATCSFRLLWHRRPSSTPDYVSVPDRCDRAGHAGRARVCDDLRGLVDVAGLIGGGALSRRGAGEHRGLLETGLPRARGHRGRSRGRCAGDATAAGDVLNRQIAALDQQIGVLVASLASQMGQLRSIPGLEATAARRTLAEIGIDMSRFGSAPRLASWAGVCPGNDESAGKRRQGRTRKGNCDLRRVLVRCAWAARKTPTYLGRTFRRLEARLGRKKAAVVVAHKILVIIYHLLAEGMCYGEQRYDHLQPRNRRTAGASGPSRPWSTWATTSP
jgi:hypothetical protein